MNGKNTIFLAIVAALLLIGQAFVVNNIDSLSQSYSFTKAPAEIPEEFYKTLTLAYKREVELARLRDALSGYRGLSKLDWSRLAEVILRESEKHGLDPILIVAIIETESTFRNLARSHKGAKGLMQIRPFVGKALAWELDLPWEGDKTLFNPYINVQLGTYYLSKLIDNFDKDIDVALTAYNYGPSYVNTLLKKGRHVPRRYARRVINNYRAKLSFVGTSLPLESIGTPFFSPTTSLAKAAQ